MKYVVYLTKYNGHNLPPWYIGSSYEEKVLNGYNGSIGSKKWSKKYYEEQKENKHLFKTRILSYHKTRKEALTEELRVQKIHRVVKHKKYFNESYAAINGSHGRDVAGMLNPNYGNNWSLDQKKKMSELNKGNTPWNKGKKNVYSENHLLNLSEKAKGKAVVKDKEGNILKISKDDKRIVTGELVGATKGLFTVLDIVTNEKVQVDKTTYILNKNYIMNSLKVSYFKEGKAYRRIDIADNIKNYTKKTRKDYIMEIKNATSK